MKPQPILALLCFMAVVATAASPAADRPHIILMLADDLGSRDMSYRGSNISTPHIDRLASRGVVLDTFYVQSVCSPTRAALMTGRYPIRYGLQCSVVRPWASHGLPLDERTLPQALKESGYATAVVGKWHLGHARPEYLPLQRGFDKQYGHFNGALDYYTHKREGGHDWHKNDQPNYDEGYTTDLIGQEASRIINEHDPDTPLFLYVPFNAPHSPYQAPDEHLERNKHIQDLRRRTHAGMVTSMDDAIGDIVAAAGRRFQKNNTLIFFCSDNGGILRAGSNGNLRGEKSHVYEGGVRAPAIMVWEGSIKPNTVVKEPLHITDLYPTLLSLTGTSLKQEKPLDGKDIWATITRGKRSPHDYILIDSTPFRGAFRMGDWKLVRNGRANANVPSSLGEDKWELYNLKTDPFEKNDLHRKNPKDFQRLKTKYQELSGQAAPPHIPPSGLPADYKVPEIWGHFE